jgi:uncharacterized membrane protein YhdT
MLKRKAKYRLYCAKCGFSKVCRKMLKKCPQCNSPASYYPIRGFNRKEHYLKKLNSFKEDAITLSYFIFGGSLAIIAIGAMLYFAYWIVANIVNIVKTGIRYISLFAEDNMFFMIALCLTLIILIIVIIHQEIKIKKAKVAEQNEA